MMNNIKECMLGKNENFQASFHNFLKICKIISNNFEDGLLE